MFFGSGQQIFLLSKRMMINVLHIFLCVFAFICGCCDQISAVRSGPFPSLAADYGDDSVDARDLPPAQWFQQRLDHFNYADNRTWKQRYFVNDSFHTPGGPVFVEISGEGVSSPVTVVEGQWINWAQQFGALCLQLEHRYYGNSRPTEDLSVENLQYLSSDQALADLALFRNSMAEKYGAQNSKWIFFGGSYAGCLAAWMRLKYPHLADGAVASSAPVKAVLDFSSYFSVVVSAIAHVSNSCIPAVSKAVSQIQNGLTTEKDLAELEHLFRLCSPLNESIEDDVMNLYQMLANNFQEIVQYNHDNRAYAGSKTANITIRTICNIMDDQSRGSEMDRYAIVNSLILNQNQEKCLDYAYSSFLNEMRNTAWDEEASSGGRQWAYQVCTEFGYLQGSDYPGQTFGIFPLSFMLKQCSDIFGPAFNHTMLTNGIKQTNVDFGSTGIRVTKVIFPNGSNDPWHLLGVLKDLGPEARALLIPGTAHCADTYPDAPWDPPQLIKTREIIKNQIKDWILS